MKGPYCGLLGTKAEAAAFLLTPPTPEFNQSLHSNHPQENAARAEGSFFNFFMTKINALATATMVVTKELKGLFDK